MNASLSSQQPNVHGPCHKPRLLFWVGVSFWPLLAAVTAVELRWKIGWFSPSNRIVWMPLAALALACSGAAPFFTKLSRPRKTVLAFCCVGAYAFAYFIVLLVGKRYLNWDD